MHIHIDEVIHFKKYKNLSWHNHACTLISTITITKLDNNLGYKLDILPPGSSMLQYLCYWFFRIFIPNLSSPQVSTWIRVSVLYNLSNLALVIVIVSSDLCPIIGPSHAEYYYVRALWYLPKYTAVARCRKVCQPCFASYIFCIRKVDDIQSFYTYSIEPWPSESCNKNNQFGMPEVHELRFERWDERQERFENSPTHERSHEARAYKYLYSSRKRTV